VKFSDFFRPFPGAFPSPGARGGCAGCAGAAGGQWLGAAIAQNRGGPVMIVIAPEVETLEKSYYTYNIYIYTLDIN